MFKSSTPSVLRGRFLTENPKIKTLIMAKKETWEKDSNLVSIVLRIPQAMRLNELLKHEFLKLYLTSDESEMVNIIQEQINHQIDPLTGTKKKLIT